MPNTFSQIYVQAVFAVKYRRALIRKPWNEEVHKYITGIIRNHGHKMLAIYAMPDHLHMFFGYNANQPLPQLIQLVKKDSSIWINKEKLCPERFRWQEGYGSFSYSRSQIKRVAAYVENQEEHHKKIDFLTEYRMLLDKFDVSYDPKYIFHAPI